LHAPVGHDVFISFAEKDREIADRVSERLARDGVGVWRYTDRTESGSWHLNQLRALRDSKVAVFVITEASADSSACLDEAQRVADPGQIMTVPIPLVVGAWSHEASDLWLLLSKWNGVVASPELTEEGLHRVADIVHSRLGSRPISSLSTGQALAAVKDDVCHFLEGEGELTSDEILEKAQELQLKHRGNMVAFSQFTHLDRELQAADLLAASERPTYVRRYLEAFFDRTVAGGHADVARRLASHFSAGETVVISEYSRVIRHALKILSEIDQPLFKSLDFVIVARTGMLLMADEPSRMAEELRAMDAEPRVVPFGAWIEYLMGTGDSGDVGHVDKLLFGVEAFNQQGDVVYPQIVKELDVLRARAALSSPIRDAEIIAAGESFKVCRDPREVSKMIADPHYTVMPAAAFDVIVTDIGEFRPAPNGATDLSPCIRRVSAAVDEIRRALWPSDSPLPVWNLPSETRAKAKVLVTDIDGTVTFGLKLSLAALARFDELDRVGVRVVLVTGRAAGWACALAHYLPGVAAVVAENGAVLIDREGGSSAPILLDGWDEDERQNEMTRVLECLESVLSSYPDAVISSDNFSRITDQAIEVADHIDPEVVARIAKDHGITHTYSSVHHHLSASRLDKESGLRLAMREHLEMESVHLTEHVVTVGDSLNDAPLFDRNSFAATVGVRGVLTHLDALGARKPGYVTLTDASEGFLEVATLLCQERTADVAHHR
jgi:HAD superfamily hydrolase (TIGR01484 family)